MPPIINLLASGYTNKDRKEGICLLRLEQNRLIMTDAISAGENPSYLISDGKGYYYAANETNEKCSISVCTSDSEGIKLQKQWHSIGNGVCHLSYEKNNGFLFASCYGNGDVVCFDTKTGNVIGSFLPEESRDAHAHGTAISRNGKWLFSVDLGLDRIYAFRMEAVKNGIMEPETCLMLSKGTGPRQLITSRTEGYLYCVNELESSVKMITYDDETGEQSLLKTTGVSNKKLLQGQNYPGTAAISNNEKYLFVPNRGANTISVFDTSKKDLKLIFECDCMGDWPRYLMLTENEKYLLAANQRSGNVVLFSFHEGNKKLLSYLDSIQVPEVSCIIEI